jgi:collagenase-like PrtC family protease
MIRKRFKILAPFTNIAEIEPLKKAGADELYCGYVNDELTKKWPLAFHILNRRGEGSSFENYEDFKEAVKKARTYNLAVYVTLNGLYTPEQYPLLHKLVKSIDRLEGVRGFIVADIGFLLFLKKNNFRKEIHVSTGGTCFNSHAAKFFENLGAKRIVLDRALTSNEIKNIITKLDTKIDIEIFIMGEPCGGFVDGFCTFFHCFENAKTWSAKDFFLSPMYNTDQHVKGCAFYDDLLRNRRFEVFNATSHKKMKHGLRYIPGKSASLGCRICDLYDLKEYPINSLKIIGRGTGMVEYVELISKVLQRLSCKHITRKSFQKSCKDLISKILFKKKRRCTKFDCYYPNLKK